MANFNEQDAHEVVNGIAIMVEHESLPRIDVNLTDTKKASIYWVAGTLRIDIHGLK